MFALKKQNKPTPSNTNQTWNKLPVTVTASYCVFVTHYVLTSWHKPSVSWKELLSLVKWHGFLSSNQKNDLCQESFFQSCMDLWPWRTFYLAGISSKRNILDAFFIFFHIIYYHLPSTIFQLDNLYLCVYSGAFCQHIRHLFSCSVSPGSFDKHFFLTCSHFRCSNLHHGHVCAAQTAIYLTPTWETHREESHRHSWSPRRSCGVGKMRRVTFGPVEADPSLTCAQMACAEFD